MSLLRHSAPLLTIAAATALSVAPSSGQDRTTATVRIGDPAPDFTLSDAHGNSYRLSDLVERGPVVLEFFRSGGW